VAGEPVLDTTSALYVREWPSALPIAGMVAFYNEKVDLRVDGHELERPKTHFFKWRYASSHLPGCSPWQLLDALTDVETAEPPYRREDN
jgi:hypothetical protein